MDIIPECTNLSVGYHGQHSSAESLDCYHVLELLEALTRLDQSKLVSKRDPQEIDVKKYAGIGSGWGGYNWFDDDDLTLPVTKGPAVVDEDAITEAYEVSQIKEYHQEYFGDGYNYNDTTYTNELRRYVNGFIDEEPLPPKTDDVELPADKRERLEAIFGAEAVRKALDGEDDEHDDDTLYLDPGMASVQRHLKRHLM
jgi:hypothetical protein